MYKIISYEYVVDLVSKIKKIKKRVCTRSIVYRVQHVSCRDLVYELGYEL